MDVLLFSSWSITSDFFIGVSNLYRSGYWLFILSGDPWVRWNDGSVEVRNVPIRSWKSRQLPFCRIDSRQLMTVLIRFLCLTIIHQRSSRWQTRHLVAICTLTINDINPPLAPAWIRFGEYSSNVSIYIESPSNYPSLSKNKLAQRLGVCLFRERAFLSNAQKFNE